MKILSNRNIKNFLITIIIVLTFTFFIGEVAVWLFYKRISLILPVLYIILLLGELIAFFLYFYNQNKIIENATIQIESYLAGNADARIECNKDGEMYSLFHSVNTLASVLSAHATKELNEKDFLKNTISDISHQLKTPLAALNIYNGILQNEVNITPEVSDILNLSEKELDRIEDLVQIILKITKLDAGAVKFNMLKENVLDIIGDIYSHFSYRAKAENKIFTFDGDKKLNLLCDRKWISEAINNIVKNAFDHTNENDFISIEWRKIGNILQIKIKDSGVGIHSEDIHHIFKRFYRSRFSKDSQGVGLGLPFSKSVIEAHRGTIEVDSELNVGTTFIINFLI